MSTSPKRAASSAKSIHYAHILFVATLILTWGVGVILAFYDALNHAPQRPIFMGLSLVAQGIFLTKISMPGASESLDSKQTRARLTTLFMAGMVISMTPTMLYPKPSLASWAFDFRTGAYFFLVLSLSAAVYLGPGFLSATVRRELNDEVTRSFRLRALQLGYFMLVTIALIFCVAELYYLQDVMRFLPLGLAAGVVVPSLYFVFLDWWASRSG